MKKKLRLNESTKASGEDKKPGQEEQAETHISRYMKMVLRIHREISEIFCSKDTEDYSHIEKVRVPK